MPDQLRIQAPAKINLFLKVLGRREDGFHDICSLVQMVDLYDDLRFTRIEQGIELEVAGADLPTDERNLVWRAADLMQCRAGCGGVRIELQKRIPIEAGLGGGSSDAATTLVGLNNLYGLRIQRQELSNWAAELGSDVPFFLSSGQAMISGRGEEVKEVALPTDYQIVIIAPNFSVSTAWAYQQLRIPLTRRTAPPSFKIGARGRELVSQLLHIGNDFEGIVTDEYPEVRVLLKGLRQAGAGYAALSGSGSAVFGVFVDDPIPDALFGTTTTSDLQIFEVRPVCRY
jgi:4-diphosphocytidyl-2-C-methyl-D-erythritol kinase